MKKIENIGFGDLKLIQDENGFKFGVDAVILAGFAAEFCKGAERIADLGTGNGIIPLILTHKLPQCELTGIDFQEEAIKLAGESFDINNLSDRAQFIKCDVAHITEEHPKLKSAFDAVVSNPPYVARGSGIVNESSRKFMARQETTAGIEEFISAAAGMLRNKGNFCLIHRPSRLVDIVFYCRKYRLEPKNIRFVKPSPAAAQPNMVMIHCVLGGGPELNFMEDLYVYDEKGGYSPEIMKIYEKQVENISISCNNIIYDVR